MLYVNFINTVIFIFSFLLIYLSIMVSVRSPLKKHSEILSIFSNKILKTLQEALGGIKDVLLNNTQELHTKIFNKADLVYRKSQGSIHIISGTPRFLVEGVGIIAIAYFGYYYSSNFWCSKNLTPCTTNIFKLVHLERSRKFINRCA